MSSPWRWRTFLPLRNYVENIQQLVQIFLFQRHNIWFYACWVKSARDDLIEPNREQKGKCSTVFLFWLQHGSKRSSSTHFFVSLGQVQLWTGLPDPTGTEMWMGDKGRSWFAMAWLSDLQLLLPDFPFLGRCWPSVTLPAFLGTLKVPLQLCDSILQLPQVCQKMTDS